jgi:hypothetical protein
MQIVICQGYLLAFAFSYYLDFHYFSAMNHHLVLCLETEAIVDTTD